MRLRNTVSQATKTPTNKRPFWKFQNAADGGAELLLYGDIADSEWWGDEVTAKAFAEDLAALGPQAEITVRINSGGGDVFAAQAIGNSLEANSAKVTARIEGLCASAATVVACHCDKVVAAADSVYMIHPVKMGMCGYMDAKELESALGALATIRDSIVNLYAKKTGRPADEVGAQMDETNWWTAQEAMDNGFVDEVDEGANAVYEDRAGRLFVNSVDSGIAAAALPDFVHCQPGKEDPGGLQNISPAEPEDNNHSEVGTMEIRNADDLRREYPDFVREIEDNAASAERDRIRDIEEMELPGEQDAANAAKFTNPISASDYAIAAMKRARAQGDGFLKAMQQDAENGGANNVGQAPAANSKPGDKEDEDFMNAIRKANKAEVK